MKILSFALLLLLIIVSLTTTTTTSTFFVDAWSCEGHALIIGIAQEWLLVNVHSLEFRNIVPTYFGAVTERALSYDDQPFPALDKKKLLESILNGNKKKEDGGSKNKKGYGRTKNGNQKRHSFPIRTTISALGCMADDLRSAPTSKGKWTQRNRWHFENQFCFGVDDSVKCSPSEMFSQNNNNNDYQNKMNALILQQNNQNNKNNNNASANQDESKGGLLVSSLESIIENLQLMAQTGALGSGTPRAAEDFAYLLHLVADIHQPLHSCSSAGEEFRKFYSEKQLQKFDQERNLAEQLVDESDEHFSREGLDEDDDDEDDEQQEGKEIEMAMNQQDEKISKKFSSSSLTREQKLQAKQTRLFRKRSATMQPSDRGGNFWCIDGGNKEQQQHQQESENSSSDYQDKISKSSKKVFCKRSLHQFYDSVAGYLYENNLKSIVKGLGAGDDADKKHCSHCEDKKDIECCLSSFARELIEYSFDHGDDEYFRQLKDGNLNPRSWLSFGEAKTCKATKFDKIRVGQFSKSLSSSTANSAESKAESETAAANLKWRNGAKLVPGEKLSAEYKLWAKDLLKKRLVLAGFRLGYVMKQLFNKRSADYVPRWEAKKK